MVLFSSKKQYIQTYLNLINQSGSDDITDIFKYIKTKENVKPTTRLNYLNSIISLKKLDSSSVKGDLSKIIELRDQLKIELDESKKDENLNEKQKDIMAKINLDDLKDFEQELFQNKNKNLKSLENYLLVSLMVNYPLRNDLMEIYLSNHKTDLTKPINLIYIPKMGKCILSLKEYKTSRTEGEIKIELNKDISDALRELIRINPNREYLFITEDGNPLSTSTFTYRLGHIFKSKFGMPITSTILRKIVVTSKYGDVLKDMEKDAHIMGHSMATQQSTYIAKNMKDVKSNK
jgi:integrase